MNAENMWHNTYCRWYDHRKAGNRLRASAWGWLADRICRRLTTSLAAGVNDGPGRCFPAGVGDAPNKSKGAAAQPIASRPAPAVTPDDHECVFVEEQEPSGRLVLPPCIACGLTAMDVIEQLRTPFGERGDA